MLRAGALPAPVDIIEERVIGPSLGAESVRMGTLSVIVGLIAVLIFMVAYYKLAGVIANFALIWNIILVLAILASLNATLTLPGIAGLILTVGMSIDANVIIFERIREELKKGNRLFIAGLREMNPDINYYPDANSTMRATYGNIGDYNPGEAMHYDYYTTIDGVMEKEDSTNEEFMVPSKLKELYEFGDYGQYADKDGNLRVNFISNNDITGGNSGSPVINGWGELVGTAFDGNWEAMSGDIAFEKDIQRTISVDIRYTMFIIDKFAGATHLIDEMTIAPKHAEKMTKEELAEAKMEAAIENPNVIVKELKMKKYLGNMLPVFDMHSFGSAFDMAVDQYGSSKEQRFWWHGKVYTTEKK